MTKPERESLRARLAANPAGDGYALMRGEALALLDALDQAEVDLTVAETQRDKAWADLLEIPSVECPCCGDVGAWPTMFHEGDPLVCGCKGHVVIGDDEAYILVDEDIPCPQCDQEVKP